MHVQVKNAPPTAHNIMQTAGVRYRGGREGEGGVSPVLVGFSAAAEELGEYIFSLSKFKIR